MTDTAELEARIAALEGRLTRLEDIEAIKRLQRAYGYYLDKGLWSQMAALFAEDGTAEIAARGKYIGRDSVLRLFREVFGKGQDGLPHGKLMNHFQLQGIVTVAEDGRTASARWRAFIQAGDLGGDAHWAEGPYEMRYVKGDDGIWRIRQLLWFATYYTGFDKGWSQEGRPRNKATDDIPPDAPPSYDYETFPNYYVPPYHYVNPVTGQPVT